jgi:hypothetical protein
MPTRASAQAASPLDAFLARFLDSLAGLPDGFSPTVDAEVVAMHVDVLPAFVDALFVSARTRGLIEPFRSKNARGRYRWHVSSRGRAWLAVHPVVPLPTPAVPGQSGVVRPDAADADARA